MASSRPALTSTCPELRYLPSLNQLLSRPMRLARDWGVNLLEVQDSPGGEVTDPK